MKSIASYFVSNICVLNIVNIEYGINDRVILSLCTGDRIIKTGITRQIYHTKKGAYINILKKRLYMHEFIKAGL